MSDPEAKGFTEIVQDNFSVKQIKEYLREISFFYLLLCNIENMVRKIDDRDKLSNMGKKLDSV